jgi:hypothetical protein
MTKFFQNAHKGFSILVRRFRTQGVRITFLWLYGRGLPAITGIPLLEFSQVTPQLFVGPQFRAAGKQHLLDQGIRACVNMRIEKDDSARGLDLPMYLYLPTVDDDAPSTEHLDRGVEFIRSAIQAGEKVYIHCGAGVGRAPTMAAAYLIATGLSLEQALVKIRRVRPFITITPVQMDQLQRYEQRETLHQGPGQK